MAMKMSEKEAEAFFARINRPMPRSPEAVRAAGVEAVRRALEVHAAGVAAVAGAL